MNVLLVYPDYRHRDKSPPLGLMYVASVLEENGHDVRIMDFGVERSPDFASSVRGADLLGIGFSSQQLREARELANRAKKFSPDTKIVVGGPHATIFEERVLKEIPSVDYVAMGEGEYIALDLANEMEPEKIGGLLWKDKEGRVRSNRPRPLISKLDELPFPARHLVPLKRYTRKGAILTSRGCPFRCIYCFKRAGRIYRAHSPDYVLREMDEMAGDYGIREFYVVDDNFLANRKRVSEIADGLIERGSNHWINLWGGARVDFIARNEPLIAKLAKAGLKQAGLGIETIVPEVLEASTKDITREEIDKAIGILRKYGISFFVFLMVGLPGDRYEFVERTKRWIVDNRIDEFGVSLTTPYPKTELWDYVNRYGRWLTPPDQVDLNYSYQTTTNVYPMWDTEDFPADQRMRAIIELFRFSTFRKGFLSRDRLSLTVKHPELAFEWFTKWVKVNFIDRLTGWGRD